jgi:SpoVK/Ycf46/Vps4 family AAA+-type ATPase
MEVYKWWSWSRMRATGRVMVDIATHEQFQESRMRGREHDGIMRSVPEDKLWMTDCHVYGFSFVTKQWGRMPVANLAPIEFRKDAYDQLVMDPDKKMMVQALVQDSSSGFSDIIAGKGGGCIFLLHGEPGVGKTLTAEAVSELLQRPLYSVSVGELGTDPATMEKNLRQILDVAQIWNAVILMDEADIFLEKRTTGDILRNSMIGIMLKLLEYHQGVMFLTTNRVQEFDPAFYSRISIALRYSALNSTTRESIWRNLLTAAGVEGLDVVALAQHDLNGRQIKNTIRLAQSLARQEGVPLAPAHVEQCLAVGRQFVSDLAG